MILSRSGADFVLDAETDAIVFVMSGTPLGEPVAGYGPFVMNTPREIQQAFADYQAGALEPSPQRRKRHDRPSHRPLRRACAARLARRDVHRALARPEALHVHASRHGAVLRLDRPSRRARFTFWGELVGGVALVAGIGTRIVALGLIPILLGATWVHAGNGWVFSAANGGWEYPVFLIAASVVAALLGDGRYAVSNLFNTRKLQGACMKLYYAPGACSLSPHIVTASSAYRSNSRK